MMENESDITLKLSRGDKQGLLVTKLAEKMNNVAEITIETQEEQKIKFIKTDKGWKQVDLEDYLKEKERE